MYNSLYQQCVRLSLSYAKYLEQENDDVINRIINGFKADQYWLLWMTLIEIIVTSSNEWKYAASKKIIDFYKRTSLRKGWSNLIDEQINRVNNLH